MSLNPYSPPGAIIDDVMNAPPLWNPNAAANWSLLFSPAFGAFVHMKNWQALGEPEKAANAKTWAIASLVSIVLSSGFALMSSSSTDQGMTRMIGFILLLSWYFSSGRAQAKYVETQFGKTYPRRGWLQPLLFAVLVFVAYLVVLAIFGFASGGFAGKD